MRRYIIITIIIPALFILHLNPVFANFIQILEWNAPTSGGPVDFYNLYYSRENDLFAATGNKQLMEKVPVIKDKIYEIPLEYGVKYFFYIAAENTVGEGEWSDVKIVIGSKAPTGFKVISE